MMTFIRSLQTPNALTRPDVPRKLSKENEAATQPILRSSKQGGIQMVGKKTSVFGVYCTPDGVERAGEILVTSGFSDSDISMLLPQNIGGRLSSRGILLSVQCGTSDEIARAKEILERTMAQDGCFARAASADSAIFSPALHRGAAAR
jgi:hypothetical protein